MQRYDGILILTHLGMIQVIAGLVYITLSFLHISITITK